MARPAYSIRFALGEIVGAGGTVGFSVPAGHRYVVRDIDASGESVLAIAVNSLVIGQLTTSPAGSSWRGRLVVMEGDAFEVINFSADSQNIAVSGYDLVA